MGGSYRGRTVTHYIAQKCYLRSSFFLVKSGCRKIREPEHNSICTSRCFSRSIQACCVGRWMVKRVADPFEIVPSSSGVSAGDCLLRKRLCFAPLILANVQCTASAVLEARCLAMKVVEAVVTNPELDVFVPQSSRRNASEGPSSNLA